MPLRSGKLLKNRYRIRAALAPGGFSRVYHAHDETRAHEVAIKELDFTDDRAAKRFFGEFQTMMLLRHPNIVEVHEIIEDEGGYYMVMEYMAGGSLADALDRGEKFSIERAIEIVGTVGRALAYAHAHRVVHCDIKPANILFTADGAAKLADFGIAHISELLKAFAWTMTPHSFIAGTVQYMPPEQVDGVRDDPRIDVYSLGAALYQMLTGHDYLNFDRRQIPAAAATNIQLIKTAAPLPPSAHNATIPPWLDEIILFALAKERAERYDSIDDFLETLTRAQEEERERRAELSAPAHIAEQTEPPTEFIELNAERREESAQPESLRAPIPLTRHPSRALWSVGIVLMVGIVILLAQFVSAARMFTENNSPTQVSQLVLETSTITPLAQSTATNFVLPPTAMPVSTTSTLQLSANRTPTVLPTRTVTPSPTPTRSFGIQVQSLTGKFAYSGGGAICLINANGTERHFVRSGDSVSMSVDGTKLVYTSSGDGKGGIFMLDLTTGQDTLIVENAPVLTDFAISPNGQRVAWGTYVWEGGRNRNIGLGGFTAHMAWSADSNQIYYAYWNGTIYRRPAEGGQPVLISSEKADRGLSVSPDGSRIAFAKEGEIWLMTSDGANLRQLVNANLGGYDSVWSPDGRYIAFVSNRNGKEDIYVINADGSNQTRVTNLENNPDVPCSQMKSYVLFNGFPLYYLNWAR